MPNKGVGAAIPQTSRPEKGLSTFVGENTETLVEKWVNQIELNRRAMGMIGGFIWRFELHGWCY